jgi:hypothetical protein
MPKIGTSTVTLGTQRTFNPRQIPNYCTDDRVPCRNSISQISFIAPSAADARKSLPNFLRRYLATEGPKGPSHPYSYGFLNGRVLRAFIRLNFQVVCGPGKLCKSFIERMVERTGSCSEIFRVCSRGILTFNAFSDWEPGWFNVRSVVGWCVC